MAIKVGTNAWRGGCEARWQPPVVARTANRKVARAVSLVESFLGLAQGAHSGLCIIW